MDKTPSLPNHAGNSTQTQSHGAVSLLMRYHSAPTSVLDSLLHSEDFLCNSHVEDSDELARVCMSNSPSNVRSAAEDAHGSYNLHSLSTSVMPRAPISTSARFLQESADPNESRASGHLSSIFKRTHIDPCANFQSSCVLNAENSVTSQLSPKLGMPTAMSILNQPFLSTNNNLIRHSSFPAEILSRLGVEDSNEGLMQPFAGSSACRDKGQLSTVAESSRYGKLRVTNVEADILNDSMRVSHIPHDSTRDAHVSHHNTNPLKNTGWLESNRPHLAKGSSFNGKNTIFQAKDKPKVKGVETRSMESSLSVNGNSLFRQSSLPASLLSQLSFDGTCEQLSVPSSSGNSSEEGGSRFTSRVSGFWDEAGAGTVAFAQRKRGREVEDKAANSRMCALDSVQRHPVEEEIIRWNFGGHTDTSSGSLLSLDDSVLCRARAKRGCATHPRSIAERVRRTKISEGMRKLQELVPNMEKQTNTATMLDEAVEYVKFLQQQVQKLSDSQARCKGMCHSNSNA